MKDLSKLFGQGLLSLQVLHGSVRRAGQRLQQAAQGILCKHTYISEICMHRLESKRLTAAAVQAFISLFFRLLQVSVIWPGSEVSFMSPDLNNKQQQDLNRQMKSLHCSSVTSSLDITGYLLSLWIPSESRSSNRALLARV